jgi:hypothetical protein
VILPRRAAAVCVLFSPRPADPEARAAAGDEPDAVVLAWKYGQAEPAVEALERPEVARLEDQLAIPSNVALKFIDVSC